jgi:hypothetical protein
MLIEGGWPQKGKSRELSYDIVIDADPRIHVVCKANRICGALESVRQP